MSESTEWRRGEEVRREGSDTERRALEWIDGYLASRWPDPAQWGQAAAMTRPYVCPFMPQSTKTDSIWVTEWPGVTDPAETQRIIQEHRDEFHDLLEPLSGHAVLHKTAIFVFPDITSAENAVAAIDDVQAALKPSLISRDSMMIGQFHPWSDLDAAPPNDGKGIKPFRSPVPMIALRVIVFDDWGKFIFPFLPDMPEDREREFLIRQQHHVGWLTAVLEWDFPQRLKKNQTQWEDELQEIAAFLDAIDSSVNRIAATRLAGDS